MFSSQQESSDFDYPRGALKRYHEEEAAAADSMNGPTMGFTEHRNVSYRNCTLTFPGLGHFAFEA